MSRLGTIGVIGAVAWGTALAQTAARAGSEVRLYARDPAVAAAISRDRSHPRRLEDVPLLPKVAATARLEDLAEVDAILLAVPAQTIGAVAREVPGEAPVVICAKGFETASGRRLSEVVAASVITSLWVTWR